MSSLSVLSSLGSSASTETREALERKIREKERELQELKWQLRSMSTDGSAVSPNSNMSTGDSPCGHIIVGLQDTHDSSDAGSPVVRNDRAVSIEPFPPEEESHLATPVLWKTDLVGEQMTPESCQSFKVKVERSKESNVIQVSIRIGYRMFLSTVFSELKVSVPHWPEEALKTLYYILQPGGDVTKFPTNEEEYEAMIVEYLGTSDWKTLKPLRVVFMEGDMDLLSFVEIPSHKGCPEPMPWKQGKLLGEGAFGAVYMGMKGDGTLIAVKRLNLESDEGKNVADSYKNEYKLLQSLDHPNIVRYISSKVVSENLAVIWMEYVPGGSVANILQAFGGMSEDILRHYTRQILKGLSYLHSRNVIHRDVKPGNILVTTSGVVKLSDFGASLIVSSSMSTKAFTRGPVGTAAYLSPEQVRARSPMDYSFNVDIWSLGITAVEMLKAEMPFQDYSNQMAVLFHIGRISDKPSAPKPPVPPRGISTVAQDFLRRCLEPDPKIRPGADELLNHDFVAVDDEKAMPSARSNDSSGALPASDEDDLFEDAREVDESDGRAARSSPKRSARAPRYRSKERSGDRSLLDRRTSSPHIGTVCGRSIPQGELPREWSNCDDLEELGLNETQVLESVLAESELQANAATKTVTVDKEALDMLVSCGFPPREARDALQMHDNDRFRAADYLVRNCSNPGAGRTRPTSAEVIHSIHARSLSDYGDSRSAGSHPSSAQPSSHQSAQSAAEPARNRTNSSVEPSAISRQRSGGLEGSHTQASEPGSRRRTEPALTEAPARRPPPPPTYQLTRHSSSKDAEETSRSASDSAPVASREAAGSKALLVPPSSEVVEWRFLHHSNWHKYSDDVSRLLENAWQSNTEKIKLKIETDSTAGTEYQVTLFPEGKMEQRNLTSGYFRRIMRAPASEFERFATQAARRSQQSVQGAATRTSGSRMILPAANAEHPEVMAYLGDKALVEQREVEALQSQLGILMRDHSIDQSVAAGARWDDEQDAFEDHRADSAAPIFAPLSPLASLPVDASYMSIPANYFDAPAEKFSSALLRPAKQAQLEDGEVLVRLIIGNIYNGPEMHAVFGGVSPTPGRPATTEKIEQRRAHSWTAFVREDHAFPLSRVIKRVSFDLLPRSTGHQERQTVDISAEPYEITRRSLAPFEVEITIQLHAGPRYRIKHWLCLSFSGGWDDAKPSTMEESFSFTKYVLYHSPVTVDPITVQPVTVATVKSPVMAPAVPPRRAAQRRAAPVVHVPQVSQESQVPQVPQVSPMVPPITVPSISSSWVPFVEDSDDPGSAGGGNGGTAASSESGSSSGKAPRQGAMQV
mmetsp:Transcript_30108/g.68910  ORF Transcript_30108/g.68910 Transcript_30108/m.68910 type:complete len:1318 (-) Transcript_30108:129-4082(-)